MAASISSPKTEEDSMVQTGRLTLEKMGYSMPVDAPAYQAPPYHYRNVQAIAVAFETDPEAALAAIPAALELVEPATATLSFYWYPFTTFGPYNEAIISLNVAHKGKPLTLIQQIMVDTEPPMLAGREIWGFPKKLATIAFRRERDMIFGTLERPAGIRLASAIVRPEQPLKPVPPGVTAVSLRIIPAADGNLREPRVAEIVETPTTTEVHHAWQGTGSVAFAEHSALDPWDRFPVRKIVSATYLEYDMYLPAGRVIALP
jgi:acetoacetate decarboxylase